MYYIYIKTKINILKYFQWLKSMSYIKIKKGRTLSVTYELENKNQKLDLTV